MDTIILLREAGERNAKLRKENKSLKNNIAELKKLLEVAIADTTDFAKQADELRILKKTAHIYKCDAGRYQWLRAQEQTANIKVIIRSPDETSATVPGYELDEAIDREMDLEVRK